MTENSLPYKPEMTPEGFAAFDFFLKRSKCYLEYGCGGSTIYAVEAINVPSIISVESDKEWVNTVSENITPTARQLYLAHCDIGPTGEWGRPTDQGQVDKFPNYMAMPWHIADEHDLTPDLVLVDGRFRVASFLFSLAASRDGTIILFDDYGDRDFYHVVEEFAKPNMMYGRMAEFISHSEFSLSKIMAATSKYSIIWR